MPSSRVSSQPKDQIHVFYVCLHCWFLYHNHHFACALSHSVVSDSCDPIDQLARLLCPWDSPAKNTGVGCHSLLQGIFPSQESNLGLLHCRQILYRLSYEGSPRTTLEAPKQMVVTAPFESKVANWCPLSQICGCLGYTGPFFFFTFLSNFRFRANLRGNFPFTPSSHISTPPLSTFPAKVDTCQN